MPEKEQYLIRHKSADGNVLRVHRKTELESKGDLKDLIKLSKKEVEQGVTVDLLPEIHASEKNLRNKLLPNVKEKMNPDRRITKEGTSVYNEVEKPTTPLTWDKLQQRIAHGAKQAENVTILLEEQMPKIDLQRLALERFRNVKGLKKLTFVDENGAFFEFDRILQQTSFKKLLKPEVQIEIFNYVDKLADEYPKAGFRSIGATTKNAIAEGSGILCSIDVNPKYYNNADFFKQTIKKNIESGYLHRATTPLNTLDHEFGHVLTSNAINNKAGHAFKTDLEDIYKRYSNSLKESNAKGVKWSDNPDFISNYSHANLKEFAAEAFAFAKNDKNASKYAIEVFNLINKYFK